MRPPSPDTGIQNDKREMEVRIWKYELGLSRPTRWQRGLWIDRISSAYTAFGLGLAILHVERHPIPSTIPKSG